MLLYRGFGKVEMPAYLGIEGLVAVAQDLPLERSEGTDLTGPLFDGPLPVPGMDLDFLYDEDKLIQRRVDNLRVVPTNAYPGRSGRIERESDPARHASYILLIEPAADDDVGPEPFHHPAQLLQLDGLYLHIRAEYLDGSRKRTLVGAKRGVEGDYYLDLTYVFMLGSNRSYSCSMQKTLRL